MRTIKIAVFSLESKSSTWTVDALKKYFDVVDSINIKHVEVNLDSKNPQILVDGQPLSDYDCVYLKGSFKFLPLLTSIAHILEGKVYMPIIPSAFYAGHDKLLTQLVLQQQAIPMPKTFLAPTSKNAKLLLKQITYPIIMKFPQGTQGKGVMFADSYSAASSMLDALEALKQPVLIQEHIETGGVDTRALVVGDKVVAAMKRVAAKDEKRANIHAGGVGEPCILDEHTKKIAIKTAKAIGAEICGVDILEGHKGPMVIEVNLSPGLQGITKATGIDVADKIAQYLHETTASLHGEKRKVETDKLFEDLGIGTQAAPQQEVANEVITHLELRGERILLPKLVTTACKFKDDEDVIIKADSGKLTISRF